MTSRENRTGPWRNENYEKQDPITIVRSNNLIELLLSQGYLNGDKARKAN